MNAPILEELSISSYPVLRLADLFEGEIPSLRNFKLKDCALAWNKMPFTPALKVLHLEQYYPIAGDGRIGHDLRQTFHSFMDALRGIPSIEDLHLHGYLYLPGSQSASTSPPVLLPDLRSLKLVNSIGAITDILEGIRVPRAAMLHLVVTNGVSSVETINTLLLRAAWPHRRSGVESLSLEATESRGEFNLTYRMKFAASDSESLCLILSLQDQRDSLSVRILLKLVEYFDVSNLLSFGLFKVWPDAGMIRLMDTLSRLPKLKDVTFEGRPEWFQHFLNILDKSQGHEGSDSPQVPFPGLSKIRTHGMNLYECAPSLIRIMQQRGCQHGVEVWDVQKCVGFGPRLMKHAQTVLPELNVVWDGRYDLW